MLAQLVHCMYQTKCALCCAVLCCAFVLCQMVVRIREPWNNIRIVRAFTMVN